MTACMLIIVSNHHYEMRNGPPKAGRFQVEEFESLKGLFAVRDLSADAVDRASSCFLSTQAKGKAESE